MTKKKHVAIVGTVGLPAKYGGFETLTQNLVQQLNDKFDFTVYCSSKVYGEQLSEWNGAKLKYVPLYANGIQSIPYDVWCIISAARHADVILILGVSGVLVLPFLGSSIRRKTVINIDGLEWKRVKWNTIIRRFLKYSEKIAVKCGGIIIADNEEIRRYVEMSYGKRSALIEYGADHIFDAGRMATSSSQASYAFTVCRIEPENNIHLILEAFAESGRRLKIVGNWENSAYGKKLFESYSNHKEIELIPPIYDQEKLDVLRSNCSLYIHGHSAGGTNPSLVEAMYIGLPIAAFDVPYNRATTENKAYFFKDKAELVEILKTSNGSALNEVALKLKEIAQKRYTWRRITEKYAEVFNKYLAD